MHLVDHVVVLLLFVVQPIHGAFEWRYYMARVKAGQPAERTRLYRQIALTEWIFLIVLLAVWIDLGRPLADLGFVKAGGPGLWVGTAFCLAVAAYLLYVWRSLKTASVAEKQQHADSLGDIVTFVPHTKRELHNFYAVSITAGVVEEIIYRGFLIWYLSQFMPVWGAVAVSSIAFGFGHSYQGAKGAARVGLVGLASVRAITPVITPLGTPVRSVEFLSRFGWRMRGK